MNCVANSIPGASRAGLRLICAPACRVEREHELERSINHQTAIKLKRFNLASRDLSKNKIDVVVSWSIVRISARVTVDTHSNYVTIGSIVRQLRSSLSIIFISSAWTDVNCRLSARRQRLIATVVLEDVQIKRSQFHRTQTVANVESSVDTRNCAGSRSARSVARPIAPRVHAGLPPKPCYCRICCGDCGSGVNISRHHPCEFCWFSSRVPCATHGADGSWRRFDTWWRCYVLTYLRHASRYIRRPPF